MNRCYTKTFIAVGIILLFLILPYSFGQTDTECTPSTNIENRSTEELSSIIESCTEKLKEIKTTINSLSTQINYMNTQIYLTKLKINRTQESIKKTEQEISALNKRIDNLDSTLTDLSSEFLILTQQVYKIKTKPFFAKVLAVESFPILLKQYKYLKTKINQTHQLMLQIQKTKLTYQEQKDLRQQKQKELEAFQITLRKQEDDLHNQQRAKQKLLAETKNNEKIYQQILNKARREYEAITAIVTGKGKEVKIKEVKAGELIANIIPGPSCNSSGAHVHFIIKENGSVQNPFSYLRPVDFVNCSGSSCGSGDGDPFNPSGEFIWPIEPPITLNQGYGRTWAVQHTWVGRIYQFHNGIDIKSSSYKVKAIFDGTLYKGTFSGSRGCSLPYVKVVNGNLEAYYLHVYSKY